jgi:RNA polymerase sigma-70 factor, ECF subfamily
VSLGPRFDRVLAAARAGDRDAFAELWCSAHPMLIRYLRVVGGDSAEDVASEAWLKAMAALGSFAGDEHGFRGWLVVIARNLARDRQRRDGRRRELVTDQLVDEVEPAPDAADQALLNQSTRAALRLVATLPPGQAELVMLRVVAGLEVAEVARITGRTPGAVRVAVHRALKTLAARLTGADPTGADPGQVTLVEARALGRRDV